MGIKTWQILMSIILVYDKNHDQILKTLAQLEKVKAYNFGFETIVSFLNPAPDFEDELRSYYPEVVVEKSVKKSVAQAKNKAAMICKSNELLFLDPVFKIPPLMLLTLYQQKIIHKDYSILTARQQDTNGNEIISAGYFSQVPIYDKFPNIIQSIYNWATKDNSEISNVDWICESLFMIDKKSFQKSGGWYEEDFFMYSGIELSSRVLEQNGKIGCLNNVVFLNQYAPERKQPLYIPKNWVGLQNKKN